MKHISLAVVIAIGAAATASATVTYSTTGMFDCTNGSIGGGNTLSGCNGSAGSSTINLVDATAGETITLAFTDIVDQTVNALSGTNASYGSIQATCTGAGCVMDAAQIDLASGFVTLNVLISEIAPDSKPNNSAGSANLSGEIANDSSTLTIGSYSGSPVSVVGTDTVIYTMDTSQALFAPINGPVPGLTELGMEITDENVITGATPEPVSLAMVGGGLMALGLIARRRRRT